jgi:hypothetical protein
MIPLKILMHHELVKTSFFVFIILNMVLFVREAQSHELQENRASLVLRNERQISVTFYLNLTELLHKTLMPKQDRFEHTAKLAAMNEADFSKQYGDVKKLIESSVLFNATPGKKINVREWQWPEPKVAQKNIRELTMQSVVSSGQHFHENPIEVRLQIQSDESIDPLMLELPVSMKPMTLVASRPKQTRFDLSAKKITINF